MKLYIRHQFRDLGNFYVTNFFNRLYKELQSKYPIYSFDIVNDKSYENNGYGSIYSCMNFSIINPKSNKYILVSFFDNWKYHFMKHLGWRPSNMVQFFYPGGFNYIDYFSFKKDQKNNNDIDCPINIDQIYKCFFYSPYEVGSDKEIEDIYISRKIKESIDKLYFRGYLWDFRRAMVNSIDSNSILIIDKNIDNNNLSYLDYLKDLSNYRCALSLPGGTEICNRDIECFSIGVPVIRPYINIHYPDPLIPNYHYISCYTDCKYWSGDPFYLSYKDFILSLEYYWDKVKDNLEYLNFIAYNARLWFLKNCTLDNNITYILSQLNMELLND